MNAATKSAARVDAAGVGQVVLVLQGGGALGAYQAGVYQALEEGGVEPDWVIGTSIGAINASLIAGNPLKKRLERLTEFWYRVRTPSFGQLLTAAPMFGHWAADAMTVTTGVRGFFEPNPLAFLGPRFVMGSESAGYYSTNPLRRTLEELVDPELLNSGKPRLTIGAANVRTGEMRYFDSRNEPLALAHIMASGALPPAFPAVRIGEDLYWDGGILSNTPIEAVFDDNPRRSGLIFAVHLWSPNAGEPDTIWKVLTRRKDLQYTSRAKSHIARQKQLHKLRHVIMELSKRLPEDKLHTAEVKELTSYGCVTRMHVVRLRASPLAGDDYSKDIDFSADGIKHRWEAGYADTMRVLSQAPWTHTYDPLEGFILHDCEAGQVISEG